MPDSRLQVHAKQESVLIHCSDGWDRTAQLTALSQLMLDPFYRTFAGFKALIRKEWIAFGHKFEDRFGRTLSKEKEASPIFVQFLDCVWQLMRVNPAAFAFGPEYLVRLYEAVVCGRYGTFLGNSERTRIRDRLHSSTHCLWTETEYGNFDIIFGTVFSPTVRSNPPHTVRVLGSPSCPC